MTHGHAWSAEEDAELRDGVEVGATLEEIADQVELPLDAVAARPVVRVLINSNGLAIAQDDALLALLEEAAAPAEPATADPDLAAIETQFHHLVRIVPAQGLVVANGEEAARRQDGLAPSSGKVPILWDGDVVVWDSLAIIEYLNEKSGGDRFWPADEAARAMARTPSTRSSWVPSLL
mgnify:CR=1 FL=1